MIKLKNIVRNEDKIVCEAYIEDCSTPVNLCYDRKNKEFDNCELPNGYEWCKSHIHHAEIFLRSVENEHDIPRERTIMWY